MKHSFRCDAGTALIQTDRGLVKGYEHDGLLIFKGIPYAKARRFHAPEQVKAWDGVFDASNYGFVCPLLTNDRPNGELHVPHRFWPMDEDCLNLNIWTPGTDEKSVRSSFGSTAAVTRPAPPSSIWPMAEPT